MKKRFSEEQIIGFLKQASASNRFKVFSAGSQPTGTVNPFALAQLQAEGIFAARHNAARWRSSVPRPAPASL